MTAVATVTGAAAALCLVVACASRRGLALPRGASNRGDFFAPYVCRLGARALSIAPALRGRLEGWTSLAAGPGSAEWVLGRSLAAAALGLVVAPVVGTPGVLLLALVAALPLVRLGRAAARAKRAIDAELPVLLEVLAAATKGGTSMLVALEQATKLIDGRLKGELREALRRMSLGRRWDEELSALANRCGAPDLTRLVGALNRARRLGTPVSSVLTDLAADARRARRAKTLERARTAPVKMLLPLVFFILPAFLLLTVVPVFVSTVEAIR